MSRIREFLATYRQRAANFAARQSNRLREFRQIYRTYRRSHPPAYAARIAYGIAVRGLPF